MKTTYVNRAPRAGSRSLDADFHPITVLRDGPGRGFT
jgi:hypothetical protein